MTCVLCGAHTFTSVWGVKKCITCGLVQVVPMPSEKKIHGLYDDDMQHFEPYIAQIPVHRKYFRKTLQAVIPAKAGIRVSSIKPKPIRQLADDKKPKLLDIGCAMGILLEEAKRAGYSVQGIDISADAVAYCRKKGLPVYQGTVTSPAVAGLNSFDVVTAFEIIEHEREPLPMMKRIHKLLKNGGIAVLTTPNHDSGWRKIMGRWWVGYRHPEHVTFWDPATLRELFKRAGFENSIIRRDCPRPFPLSFVFIRGADYVPCLAGRRAWAAWVLKPVGQLLERFKIRNPINPWDDLIVIGKK
ncbi:MAG: class I SAM-dependent methyltransferase [Candidatus Gottesmanbacteria bacterium]|nr:class I SAM-dependent methyltransferase [Candidatus Gottesmanbacteria bacterium]